MSRGRKPGGQAALGLDDPVTIEIREIAERHRQQQKEADEEFRLAWAQRLERGVAPPLPSSTPHRHNEACLGPVHSERVRANRGRQVVEVNINVRRCSFSGIIVEV